MVKKDKKKGGEFFRLPTSDLESQLLDYEAQLKIAGDMEDFESIASLSEVCGDIIYVLNARHMGKYIFPKTLQGFDEFHEMKLNGKLLEAVGHLDKMIEMKQTELDMMMSIKKIVNNKINGGH